MGMKLPSDTFDRHAIKQARPTGCIGSDFSTGLGMTKT